MTGDIPGTAQQDGEVNEAEQVRGLSVGGIGRTDVGATVCGYIRGLRILVLEIHSMAGVKGVVIWSI